MNNTIKKEKIGMDMTEGAVMKTLLLFSMPLIAANLLQEFYSMVDLMVIGQFAGSVGTVGVSTGGEIADILTPAAMALADLYCTAGRSRRRETNKRGGWNAAFTNAGNCGCFFLSDPVVLSPAFESSKLSAGSHERGSFLSADNCFGYSIYIWI